MIAYCITPLLLSHLTIILGNVGDNMWCVWNGLWSVFWEGWGCFSQHAVPPEWRVVKKVPWVGTPVSLKLRS